MSYIGYQETTKWWKYDHITPVLVDLHWLPVEQRIEFKILLLTYKALNGLAPAYLRELLDPYTPVRTLLSMENDQLTPHPWKMINWRLRDVDWRTLDQHRGTACQSISNNPHLWTFLHLVRRHISYNLLIHCLNRWVYAIISCYVSWNG